jgi:DNA-binding response OmpR family regulator
MGIGADILLVEDEPSQRAVLGDVLRVLGYQCFTAASCAEGREALAARPYACALIDVGLPDGNGNDLVADVVGDYPSTVMVMLTGDASTDTVIRAMRAGAFDYLTKPVDTTTLRAALSRAVAHHQALYERDEYNRLLLQERELLKARIEAATLDIRQYASYCERSNARLQSLLELTQVSSGFYTHESLMQSVFAQLSKHLPVECVALCDVVQHEFLSAFKGSDGKPEVLVTNGNNADASMDALLTMAEPGLLVQTCIERYVGLDTQLMATFVYPQSFFNRHVCTVAFYLDPAFEGDASEQEYLSMCAHFLTFEWQQARLLLHAAHHVSLGTIALELLKSFVQSLTAIRTATDFIRETALDPDAEQGARIILDNVERLSQQTHEFRKLSTLHEGCVETVRLDEYIQQAVDMLQVTLRSRNIDVRRDLSGDSECVLLNGTVLARTVLDLLSNAVRAVDINGSIDVILQDVDRDHVALEIAYSSGTQLSWNRPGSMSQRETDLRTEHPKFQLAQRTVHSCGGTLTLEHDTEGRDRFRILLPRNATAPAVSREVTL